jgi:hypothetical protein
MNQQRRSTRLLGLAFALAACGSTEAGAASDAPTQKETTMTRHATGPFDVKVSPLPLAGPAEDASLGRMSIEKQFHGDLEATGAGQMLTAGTDVKGSAAYVAIERVTGTLHGRKGTFALQHQGTMTRGEPKLAVSVVPDSGTGELVGLAGTLQILIAAGKHSYDFEYTLPDAK